MRIGLHHLPQRLIAILAPPDGRQCQEEAMCGRIAINGPRSAVFLEMQLKAIGGCGQSAHVSDIFSQSKLTVYKHAVQWLILAILSCKRFASFPELCKIFF